MSARALALATALFFQHAAFAQEDIPDPRDAQIEELKRRIEESIPERDAQIEELKRRVEALERERAAMAPANTVEPEEAARALERTLSREGALVLPKGAYDLEPRLDYTHGGSRGLDIVTINGTPQVVREDLKQDRVEASGAVRRGLGHGLQGEIRVPYALVREDRSVVNALPSTVHDHGVGDVELTLTGQLTRASADKPVALASLLWRLPTGRFRVSQPSPGHGFYTVQPALTVVKRDDPVVFLATVSYAWTPARSHEGSDINPGDALGLRLMTLLAASPQTSLRTGIDLSRAGRTRLNGVALPGSDTSLASLLFGFSTLISRRTLLDVQFSAGLTPDAPHYALSAALPIRFR